MLFQSQFTRNSPMSGLDDQVLGSQQPDSPIETRLLTLDQETFHQFEARSTNSNQTYHIT